MTKQLFDISIGVASFLILSPLLWFLALITAIFQGLPIFFRQMRPGLNGAPFYIYKFRTMLAARDENGNLLPDENRITVLGRFLRSTSLDELPELFNVLKGEMSIVGPRPLLFQYLKRYSPKQARRHEVKPGLTGWAQVKGRNTISWEEKFNLDVWYVDNVSFWLDMKIIAMTVWKIVKREGISQVGHATMEEFFGSKAE